MYEGIQITLYEAIQLRWPIEGSCSHNGISGKSLTYITKEATGEFPGVSGQRLSTRGGPVAGTEPGPAI